MNCAHAEILICDLTDGTLIGDGKAELESHLAGCIACMELARDAAAAVRFMERAATVEPPPELANRILAETASGRHGQLGANAGWFSRLLRPVLQPRLVMGMAMTIFSFAMIARLTGMPSRQLTPADLNPVRLWSAMDDRVYRTWQRSVKFYESIRLVYQVQSRLREWDEQQEQEEQATPQDGNAKSK